MTSQQSTDVEKGSPVSPAFEMVTPARRSWLDDLHAVSRTAMVYAILPPWTAFWSVLGLAASRLDRARSLNRVWVARGFFNPGLLAAAGIRVEVAGLERLVPGHPYLYASNHQGHLDIPALVCALPTAVTFITKVEIFKIPLFGRCLLEAGHIPVIRERRAQAAGDGGDARRSPETAANGASLAGIARMASAIADGSWSAEEMITEAIRREKLGDRLVIFPEGTRSKTGEIAPFKSGMAAIARGADVPVVPICIHGSGNAYGRDKHLLRPGVIRVAVGEPVAPDDPDLTAKVRERIIALQPLTASGGPEFRPASGVLEGALQCEERGYPGSGAAPNPMLGVFAPAPRRLVLVGVEHCLTSGDHAIADGHPKLRPGMVTLVRYHQERGDAVALIGNGPEAAVLPVAKHLGVEHVLAPRAEDGSPSHDAWRLGRARALAERLGLGLDQAVFYSGSVSDGPLLDAVKYPVVISPSRSMRRLAGAHGWPMMQVG